MTSAALALCVLAAGCGRDPMQNLVERCVTKAGAWRYGTGKANDVLLMVDEDPLGRGGDTPKSARILDAPMSANWMLEHGLLAVEFPSKSAPGLDTVGRVSLVLEGDPRCDAFARDPETVAVGGRLKSAPDKGLCVGLERGVPRRARYAAVTLERSRDGSVVNELIDLRERRVLARVVDFIDPAGGRLARSCADTPKGAPAQDATEFVLASLEPEPGKD